MFIRRSTLFHNLLVDFSSHLFPVGSYIDIHIYISCILMFRQLKWLQTASISVWLLFRFLMSWFECSRISFEMYHFHLPSVPVFSNLNGCAVMVPLVTEERGDSFSNFCVTRPHISLDWLYNSRCVHLLLKFCGTQRCMLSVRFGGSRVLHMHLRKCIPCALAVLYKYSVFSLDVVCVMYQLPRAES